MQEGKLVDVFRQPARERHDDRENPSLSRHHGRPMSTGLAVALKVLPRAIRFRSEQVLGAVRIRRRVKVFL